MNTPPQALTYETATRKQTSVDNLSILFVSEDIMCSKRIIRAVIGVYDLFPCVSEFQVCNELASVCLVMRILYPRQHQGPGPGHFTVTMLPVSEPESSVKLKIDISVREHEIFEF